MTATSPLLNAKPRSEEEAMFDVKDRRHRQKLDELLHWLRNPGETLKYMTPFFAPYADSLHYAIDQLDKNAAARILARNKST